MNETLIIEIIIVSLTENSSTVTNETQGPLDISNTPQEMAVGTYFFTDNHYQLNYIDRLPGKANDRFSQYEVKVVQAGHHLLFESFFTQFCNNFKMKMLSVT